MLAAPSSVLRVLWIAAALSANPALATGPDRGAGPPVRSAPADAGEGASTPPQAARASGVVPGDVELCEEVAQACDARFPESVERARSSCLAVLGAHRLRDAVAARDVQFCARHAKSVSNSWAFLRACKVAYAAATGDYAICGGGSGPSPGDFIARLDAECLTILAVRERRLAVLDAFDRPAWASFVSIQSFAGFTADDQCRTRWDFFQCSCQRDLEARGIPTRMSEGCRAEGAFARKVDEDRKAEQRLRRFADFVGPTWDREGRWGLEYSALVVPRGEAGFSWGVAAGVPSFRERRGYAELEGAVALPMSNPPLFVGVLTVGAGPVFTGGGVGWQGTAALGVSGLLGFVRWSAEPDGAGGRREETTVGLMLKVAGPWSWYSRQLFPARVRREQAEHYEERARRTAP